MEISDSEDEKKHFETMAFKDISAYCKIPTYIQINEALSNANF